MTDGIIVGMLLAVLLVYGMVTGFDDGNPDREQIMSIEDILYEAYEEGLRDEVFTELKRMKKKGIMQGKELSDRYDYALTQVRKYKQARAKRGTENRQLNVIRLVA